MVDTMAQALSRLGVTRALVVSSEDGLDELSTSAPTRVVEVNGGRIERYSVDPAGCGLAEAPPEAIPGGDPQENARITRAILDGEAGPARDIAVLNAGAAIYAGGRAESIAQGVRVAEEAVDSGAAARTLEAYVELSRAA
jgi:anthranilate phosphoribosyltransferase